MQDLTKHFTLEELLHSDKAEELGIANEPTPMILYNMKHLAIGLESVRTLLGTPMHINSGFRCEELNLAVRGSRTSAHVLGFAADFVSPSYGSPREIVLRIAGSGLDFDQLIEEGGAWVHISFDPRNRKIAETATFKNGEPTYNLGVK